jgi:IS30 family transposase
MLKPENDRRGQLPSTVSITGRPAIAEERSRCGDWEGDTIVSPGKRSGLVCSTDRLSGLLKLNKVKNLKSSEVIDKMRDQLRSLPADLRFTMTLDNGKEFAQHERLDKLVPEGVFFARPGHPWERGTNENTIGCSKSSRECGNRCLTSFTKQTWLCVSSRCDELFLDRQLPFGGTGR